MILNLLGLFEQFALNFGKEVLEIFLPMFEKFDHGKEKVLKENKFLLPHMIAGLIRGSYLWPKE